MKRRTFLKVVSGIASALGVGGVAAKVPAPKAKAVEKSVYGLYENKVVRELCQYELTRDEWIARWDILIHGEQYHVDMRYWGPELEGLEPSVVKGPILMITAQGKTAPTVERWLELSRPIALATLDKMLRDKGWSWKDVERCELPEGIARARYV